MKPGHQNGNLANHCRANLWIWTILALALELPPLVASGAILYGKDETLHKWVPVKLQSPQGEDLSLAFKTSTMVFGLGLYCRDDGYVLYKPNDAMRYYPLSSVTEIGRLQRAGLLPDPLPKYRVPWHEYALGYSMCWIVLAVAAVMIVRDQLDPKSGAQFPNFPSAPRFLKFKARVLEKQKSQLIEFQGSAVSPARSAI